MDKNLSDVQKIIGDIMKYLKNYLEENKITYYMLGGTLLGAIRHKGFIPWDDDIDIGIPRDDYEKFINEISKSLPEYYQLHTYKNNSSHHYYFSRIVDTRHSLKRTGSLVDRNEELWIDIFPLDGMPNGFIKRRIHMMRLLYTRAMYHISCFDKVNLKRPGRPLSERIIIKFVMMTGFGRKSNMYHWLDRIDTLLKKYSYQKSDWVVNFMGQYKFKEMFPKEWYGEGNNYQFEDSELFGPFDYDKILTQQYGDYMTPPKDTDKNAHAAIFEEKQELIHENN